jgi:hypothetical protein
LVLLVVFSTGCKEQTVKKKLPQQKKYTTKKHLRHICLSDEEFLIFECGTTADSENFLWMVPAEFNGINVCKLSLKEQDNYTLLLHKGQAPGEIKTRIYRLWFSGNCFVTQEYPTDPLQFFDKEFNYLMGVKGINSMLSDLIFKEETGELLVIVNVPFDTSIEPDKWKEYDAVSLYQIENTTARVKEKLFSYYQVYKMFKTNGYNLCKTEATVDGLIIKFLNNDSVIMCHNNCPFFIIYNFKTNNIKKVMHKVNKSNKKLINRMENFCYINFCIGITKDYIYFTQNSLRVLGNKIPDYSVFRYKLNGEYDCGIESMNKVLGLENKYVFSFGFTVTQNNKLISNEMIYVKGKMRPVAKETVCYDFNELIKEDKRLKKLSD